MSRTHVIQAGTRPIGPLLIGALFMMPGAGIAVSADASTDAPADDRPPAEVSGERSSTDDALLRSLLGEEDSENTPTERDGGQPMPEKPMTEGTDTDPGSSSAVTDARMTDDAIDRAATERLFADLKTAESNLADGNTGQSTQNAQANVIAALERLIEDARQQQSSPDGSTGQDSSDSSQQQPSTQRQPPTQPQPGRQSQDSSTAGAGGVPTGPPQQDRDDPAEESSDRVGDGESDSDSIREFRSGLVRDVWGHLPERLREQMLNVGPDRYLPEYDSLVRDYFESLARPQDAEPQARP